MSVFHDRARKKPFGGCRFWISNRYKESSLHVSQRDIVALAFAVQGHGLQVLEDESSQVEYTRREHDGRGGGGTQPAGSSAGVS